MSVTGLLPRETDQLLAQFRVVIHPSIVEVATAGQVVAGLALTHLWYAAMANATSVLKPASSSLFLHDPLQHLFNQAEVGHLLLKLPDLVFLGSSPAAPR